MGFDARKAVRSPASFGKKPFFEGGIDVGLMITKCEYKEGFKGKNYIFEFKVESGKSVATGTPDPVIGSERAYICDLDSEYGFGNLMAIAEALEGGKLPGLDDTEKKALVTDGKSMDQITEADEVAREASLNVLLANAVGARIRLTTNAIITQKGNPFTAVNWGHVAGQTLESIGAERAKITSAAAAA